MLQKVLVYCCIVFEYPNEKFHPLLEILRILNVTAKLKCIQCSENYLFKGKIQYMRYSHNLQKELNDAKMTTDATASIKQVVPSSK